MMDVYIKSFGRTYYLDRCIQSIRQFLDGPVNVVVLDDGTDPLYLNQIKTLHPDVIIKRSSLAEAKSNAVRLHLSHDKPFDIFTIPFEFWRNEISAGSEYFLLLEEDAWLTSRADIITLENSMRQNQIVIAKLFWGNSVKMISGAKQNINADLEIISPELPLDSPILLKPFLMNVFKIRSVFLKMRVLKPDHLLSYYTLYTVSSAIFRKDFWLHCLQDAREKINEPHQLYRALEWHKSRPQVNFGKTINEKMTTSYITSTLNTYREISFDMIRFNSIMNELWMKRKMDVMQNFPLDFTPVYLKELANLPLTGPTGWRSWQDWIKAFQHEFHIAGIQLNF
jgi:hypothetical protein